MEAILILLARTVGTMLDPLALAGWVVGALIALRSFWGGLAIVVGWSIAMEAVVVVAAAQLQDDYRFGDSLPARLLAGLAVLGIVAMIAWAIRRRQAELIHRATEGGDHD